MTDLLTLMNDDFVSFEELISHLVVISLVE